MIVEQEKITYRGKEVIFRCATVDDGEMLLEAYKKVTGETPFLAMDADEINLTVEQEKAFIEKNNSDPHSLMLLVFVDGRYAGNCSFAGKTASRRTAHRASCGIALLREFTGMGLGGIALERLLAEAKKAGFEQMELEVYSENTRARKLYERLGFTECGRIPDHSRVNGESFDIIRMYKRL